MIYFWLAISIFLSIGFFFGLYVSLFQSHNLGYVKYFVLAYSYAGTLGPPLFYASFGSLFNWPKAEWLYDHIGWIFLIQIIIAMILIYTYVLSEKYLKSRGQ